MPVTGITDKDAEGTPQNSVLVPGNPKPVMMRGSTNVSTDNNNNTTTPVSFNLEQIGEVLFTLGQKIKDGSISVAIASDQIVPIQQADLFATGVINAAQSAINGAPVTGASVILAVGQGQSSWKAQLLAGTGGFTGATTIVVDGSADGGTTWYAKSFKVAGVTPNNPQSSVVGPGPLELTGNAAGLTHIKVRCSVLNSTETINVTLRAGAGVADVGLMGSLPAGANLVGGVNVVDSAGTNKLAVDSSGRITEINASPGVQGWIAASGNGTASQDNALAFAQQVRKIALYNASANNVPLEFDQTATATSFPIPPGAFWIIDGALCTNVHVFPSATLPINTTSGLYVKGWK